VRAKHVYMNKSSAANFHRNSEAKDNPTSTYTMTFLINPASSYAKNFTSW